MDELSVLQVLNNLKNIKRTGPNLFAGIPQDSIESISDHSYKVTYLVLMLSKYFNNIDLGNVLEYAVTHDWAETILMDIPSGSPSFKSYFNTDIRKVFKEAEENVLKEIFDDAGLEQKVLNEDEKQLFSFVDKVAILLELVDYKQRGYNHEWIDRMFEVQTNLLKEQIVLIKEDNTKEKLSSMLSSISFLFTQKYMTNKYLTKATRK